MKTAKRGTAMAVAALFAIGVTACGDDDGDDVSDLIDDAGNELEDIGEQVDEGIEDLAGDLADAVGAGGGGTLVFDGEEIPIESATCQFGEEDTFDVGTVSENGYRVFITRGNPLNDIGMSILDPDFVQWFPQDVTGDEAARDGETFTGGPHTFFNNDNDELVEAQVTVECP